MYLCAGLSRCWLLNNMTDLAVGCRAYFQALGSYQQQHGLDVTFQVALAGDVDGSKQ